MPALYNLTKSEGVFRILFGTFDFQIEYDAWFCLVVLCRVRCKLFDIAFEAQCR